MATSATRTSNLDAMRATVAKVAPGGDWRWLHPFAYRESRLNHAVRSTRARDVEAARVAWGRNRPRFEAANNPWVRDPSLWLTSLGLYQHVVPNHLQRWDPTAHPHVLLHPVIATFVAGRLFNRAVQLGARNLCDVRQIWATGKLRRTSGYDKRCAALRKRLAELGYPLELASRPLDRFGMQPFGLGPSPAQRQQYRAICDRLGLPQDPLAMPAEWTPRAGGGASSAESGAFALAAVVAGGVGIGVLALLSARK